MLDTTIAGYTNATTVTLAAGAGGSGSGLNWGYATDDTAAFVAANTACGAVGSLGGVTGYGGGRLMLGEKQYLVYSGLTLAAGCGLGNPEQIASAMVGGTQPVQRGLPAVIVPGSATIATGYGGKVDGLSVFQWGLPQFNLTTRIGLDAETGFAGNALTPNGSAAFSHVAVVGFDTAMYGNQTSRDYLDNFWWDSRNGVHISHSHDPWILQALHGWSFYPATASWATQLANIVNVANSGGSILVTTASGSGAQAGDLVQINAAKGFLAANGTFEVGSVAANQTDGSFTASLSGGVMTVSAVTSGNICVNETLNGNGVNAGKVVTSLPSSATYGCSNATGAYGVSSSQTLSSGSMTTTNDQLTFAHTQSSPSTACTWTSGALTMTCASLNSLAVGMTMTLNSVSHTVEAVDFQTNTILLDSKTTGTGSATSVTFSNGAYTGGGNTQVTAVQHGGVDIYGSDSQGILVYGTGPFGYATGYMAEQVSSGDKLGQFILTSANYDAQPEPYNVSFMVVNNAANGQTMGPIQWNGAHVSIGGSTPFIVDAGSSSAAASIKAAFAYNSAVAMLGSVLSGKLEVFGSDEASSATPVLLNVSSAVTELHLAGDSFSAAYLGLSPGQANVWMSGDTSINAASPGAHILQYFSSSGTWYAPAGLAYVDVSGCGGGGGGGSGGSITAGTASSGGAGGGGAGCFGEPSPIRIAAADAGASQAVTIGAGGAGAAGVTGSGEAPARRAASRRSVRSFVRRAAAPARAARPQHRAWAGAPGPASPTTRTTASRATPARREPTLVTGRCTSTASTCRRRRVTAAPGPTATLRRRRARAAAEEEEDRACSANMALRLSPAALAAAQAEV